MTEFEYPYDAKTVYRTVPKKFGHAYFEDATMTIGNTNTEWITSDTTVDVQAPDDRLASFDAGP
jgi:hypothetical protein